MQYIKLQAGCLIILAYIIVVYIKESFQKKIKCNKYFDLILFVTPFAILFDGITALTVNMLDIIPPSVNMVLHALFFLSENAGITLSFLYMHHITIGLPRKKMYRAVLLLPFIVSSVVIIAFMGQLEYIRGSFTNYSMGVSAIACFISLFFHYGMVFILVIIKRRTLESRKKMALFSSLTLVLLILIVQIIFPEALLSALLPVLMVIAIYTNFEDPAIIDLQSQNDHMVEGFATLVENRDDNTGGHIKRTKLYVRIILSEMSKNRKYNKIITKDYVEHVSNAAPMHDIGKISTPDYILKKKGSLDSEEYDIMKKHAENGGQIILETFTDLDDPEFMQIAYEVARHHHEKWNGKGYPDGLKEEEIPLHARVMAIADVFDAVSQKRCYRDALPIDECFDIISKGRGVDFDPDLTDLFLNARDRIEKCL